MSLNQEWVNNYEIVLAAIKEAFAKRNPSGIKEASEEIDPSKTE